MMSAVLGRSDETPIRDASGTVIGRVTATLAQLTMSLTSAGLCTSPVTSVHHSTATSELTEPSFEVCFNRPAAAAPRRRCACAVSAEPRPAPAEPGSGHLLPPLVIYPTGNYHRGHGMSLGKG